MYCTVPFDRFEIFYDQVSCCCPNYLPDGCVQFNPEDPNLSFLELWKNSKLREIRRMFCEGNYSHCSFKNCAYLRTVNEKVPQEYLQVKGPYHVKYSFDRTCNLKCRSCRNVEEVVYTDQKLVKKLLLKAEEELGPTIKYLELNGAGDLFASKSFKDWIISFDPKKYLQLDTVKLHTNLQLLTPDFWENKLNLVKPFIKVLEISIDAATKETYEKIRRGGKWDTLLENLNYLLTVPTINVFQLNFVVQHDNLQEIEEFFRFFLDVFSKVPKLNSRQYILQYTRVLHWTSVSRAQFLELDITEEEQEQAKQIVQKLQIEGSRYNIYVKSNL